MFINKKVKLNLLDNQVDKLEEWSDTLRYFQNLYIRANKYQYEKYKDVDKKKQFVSAFSFSKWLTTYIKEMKNESFKQKLMSVPSDARIQAIKDEESAYKKFFKEKKGFPKFKRKGEFISIWFRRTDNKNKCVKIGKNFIKVPKIGTVYLKEKAYLPFTYEEDGIKATSARITKTPVGDYYVSVMVELPDDYFYEYDKPYTDPIGIDLGLKDFAVCSNGKVYGNINKTERIRREERRLKHLQRDLSRKYECAKKEFKKTHKKLEAQVNVRHYKKEKCRIEALKETHNLKLIRLEQVSYAENEDGFTYRSEINLKLARKVRYYREKMQMSNNWYKAKKKVAKLHERLTNQRNYYIDSIINEIVKEKPIYVAIEDLNVSGMMKNKHLAKSIAQQKFFEFRTKLIQKCNQHGIQVRIVDRFYPSSQICSECGEQFKWLGCEHKNQMLKVREWNCPHCHTHHDRDLNASINIRNADKFTIATDCDLGCAYK